MLSSEQISEALAPFAPVTLDGMHNIRLMDRSDTKYVLSCDRIPEIISKMNGDYMVLEINGIRMFPYNTTYLDTAGYMFYYQHVTDKLSRYKVRFRKYAQTGTTFLEVKKKTNKGKTVKWRFENEPSPAGSFNPEAEEFISRHIGNINAELRPVLANSFSRITLAGISSKERITIDFNISFTGPDGNRAQIPSVAVLELKKENFSGRSRIMDIMKESYLYPSGFSKYCIGNALLNQGLRTNALKPKILMINKIENEHH